MNKPRTVPATVEWPTVAAVFGFWAALIGLLVAHESLPSVAVVVAFAVLGAFYMSLQHEVLHGHPTPWRRLNKLMVGTPLSLWLPYSVYLRSHLEHHRSELTMPGLDPESFYVSDRDWMVASPLRRWCLRRNRTLLGRVMLGPLLGPPRYLAEEFRRTRTDIAIRRTWQRHLLGVLVVSIVVASLAGVPMWQYVVGFCYFGLAITYLRSFVEHRAVETGNTASAVVRSGWFFGLVFLNNNLHHTHHAFPGAAWYRLPRLTRELGAERIAADGAGWYRGYGEVVRRYALKPFGTVVHPHTERAPSQ